MSLLTIKFQFSGLQLHHSFLVVSSLPVIFWRQQISWSYCVGSRRFGLMAWRNTKKKVTLLRKRYPAHGVMVRCYACYANGFRFDFHLADFSFFFLCFFAGSAKVLRLGVGVVRLGLG